MGTERIPRRPALATAFLAMAAAASPMLFPGQARAADSIVAPVVTAAQSGGKWVVLSWNVGTNEWGVGASGVETCQNAVTSYIIYRTTVTGEAWTQSGSIFVGCNVSHNCATDTRAFFDTGLTDGVVYSYVVRAVGTCYVDSTTAWVTSSTLYSGPSGMISADQGNGWVRLNWNASTVCGSGEYGVTRYRIFRAPSAESLETAGLLKEITLDSGYTDSTGLTNLREYFYFVYPAWPLRQPFYVMAKPFKPLSPGGAPQAVRDGSGPRNIRVNWPAAPPPDLSQSYALAGYAVYRSDDGGGTMKWLDTVPVGTLTYLDTTVPDYGKIYVYLVRPIDAEGNPGEAYQLALVDVVLPSNRLFLNHNKFRPAGAENLRVDFQITKPGRVRISVMTLTGERVRRLYDAEHQGKYNVDAPFNSAYSSLPPLYWDGANDGGQLVATGAYFLVLEIGGSRDIRSVAVIR